MWAELARLYCRYLNVQVTLFLRRSGPENLPPRFLSPHGTRTTIDNPVDNATSSVEVDMQHDKSSQTHFCRSCVEARRSTLKAASVAEALLHHAPVDADHLPRYVPSRVHREERDGARDFERFANATKRRDASHSGMEGLAG